MTDRPQFGVSLARGVVLYWQDEPLMTAKKARSCLAAITRLTGETGRVVQAVTAAPPEAEKRIEVEGDRPKVERTLRYFSALRAGLKTAEEVSYALERQIHALPYLLTEQEERVRQLEEALTKQTERAESLVRHLYPTRFPPFEAAE